MDISQIIYKLEDISSSLRVHLMASPLDDIVEMAIEELDELLKECNEEL